MTLIYPFDRVRNHYRRKIGHVLFRRPIAVKLDRPLISFTFDDFPRSALLVGGKILTAHGALGTYYVSLGLLGTDGPSGPLYTASDLRALLAEGHELGCHTFAHCDSWNTPSNDFEASVVQNREALAKLIPGAGFRSFSYPLSEPRPLTKMKTAKHFLCCRAGGQTFNAGTVDLNRLSAFFLEKSRENLDAVRNLVDRNCEAHGWLIFATHDVADRPSPYGCSPEFFADVVRYAVQSGAAIMPVKDALHDLTGAKQGHSSPSRPVLASSATAE